MLVSKKAKAMPPCKVTALFETMQYGVHRILTFKVMLLKVIGRMSPMFLTKFYIRKLLESLLI